MTTLVFGQVNQILQKKMAERKAKDCFSIQHGHGDRCHCGRPAKYHINYASGCGHVCGIHKQTILRKRPGSRVRAIAK